MKKVFLLSALLISSYVCSAAFVNSGKMISKHSNLSADVFENKGFIEGLETVEIECDILRGNGTIKGPKMVIVAAQCDYEGTIDCSEECILVTNTPQSQLRFTFQGGGKLITRDC